MKYRVKHHLRIDDKQHEPGDTIELSPGQAALCGSALDAVDGGEEEAGPKKSRSKKDE